MLFADAQWRDLSSLSVIPTAVEGPLFPLRFVISHSVIPTAVEGPLFSFCHFEPAARFSMERRHRQTLLQRNGHPRSDH